MKIPVIALVSTLWCTPNQCWADCITNTQSCQRWFDRILADHSPSTSGQHRLAEGDRPMAVSGRPEAVARYLQYLQSRHSPAGLTATYRHGRQRPVLLGVCSRTALELAP